MVLTSTLVCFLVFSLGLASPVADPQVFGQPTRSVIIAPTPDPAQTAKPPAPPQPPENSKCRFPQKRKAWQALSRREKKAYIDAELCLMKKPSKTKLEAAVTRFDDLIKPHQLQGMSVHNTGYFLPFHRALMHAHEVLLKTECGYKGTQPYWAEQLDIGKIEQSEVLDPKTGFGGGVLNQMACIPDGPFKDYTLHTGPGFSNTPHCIQRNLVNGPTYGARQEYIDYCYKFEKFELVWQCIEDAPHNSFHAGVGGEMLNPISSPGDPVFYLHHTWLDKIWWDWQKQKPERIYDVSGRKGMPAGGAPPGAPIGGDFAFPIFPENFTLPDGTSPLDFSGPPRWTPRIPNEVVEDPVALDDVLNMFGVIGNLTVRDVMHIQTGSPLCYEYVEYKKWTLW